MFPPGAFRGTKFSSNHSFQNEKKIEMSNKIEKEGPEFLSATRPFYFYYGPGRQNYASAAYLLSCLIKKKREIGIKFY